MRDFVVVCVLEGLEEPLVAFDVLTAICFHASMYRAFRAFVGKSLRQPRKRSVLDEFHGAEQMVDKTDLGVPCYLFTCGPCLLLSVAFLSNVLSVVASTLLPRYAVMPVNARMCLPVAERYKYRSTTYSW